MTNKNLHRASLLTGVLGLAFSIAAQPVLADQSPTISEVIVKFDDPDFGSDTVTIKGQNLLGRSDKHATSVMLGEQGPLEVLSSSDSQIIAHCFVDNSASGEPDFECDDGDYSLEVAITLDHSHISRPYGMKYDDDYFDDIDYEKHASRHASYDLTIGAVGPKGDKGEPGPAGSSGISGYEVVVRTTALNTNPYKELSVRCPSGKSVLGGGAGIFWYESEDSPKLISSFMYPSRNSWYGEAQSPSTYTASWRLEVQVICAAVSS